MAENYQKALRERICERFSTDICDEVYELVKEEALTSWKNGIQEGLKRASRPGPKRNQTYTRGSALSNGKLKPVREQV